VDLSALFRREVAVERRHRLDCVDQVVDGGASPGVEARGQRLQQRDETCLLAYLFPKACGVELQDASNGKARGIETGANLIEAEAQLAERLDLLQSRQLRRSVQSVLRCRVLGWPQEADLIVVVQRAHRKAGPFRHLADLEPSRSHDGSLLR